MRKYHQPGGWRSWWIVCTFLIAALACRTSAEATTQPPEVSVPTPEVQVTAVTPPTVAPTPQPSDTAPPHPDPSGKQAQVPGGAQPDPPEVGSVLYETDFSIGWPILEIDNGSTQPRSDGYLMDVAEYGLWAYTTQAGYSAFYVEVEAVPQQCPSGQGSYGVMFHYVSDTSFRVLIVTCSGRYVLFERTSDVRAKVMAEDVLPDPVRPGSGTHRVGVLSSDGKLTLYVDDYLVSSVTVVTMPAGDVGPYVETTGAPISVLFTRLAVYAPK